MTTNGTALAKVEQGITAPPRESAKALEPTNLDEAWRLAKIFVASRLLPKAVTTPEAAFTIIAAGRELGLTAMQSLRSIHVIEGRPTLSADLMLALAKRHESCKFFRLVESSERIATYETLRAGEPSPTRMSFTIEEAQRAGVTGKDNWRKYPAAMLRARCITALTRAVYPDAFLAVYDPDELEPAQHTTVEVTGVVPDAPKSEPRVSGNNMKLRRKFMAELRKCKDGAEVGAIATKVAEEKRAGNLTQEDRDAIAHVYEEVMGKLLAASDEAKRVAEEDRAQQAADEMDAAEAEADAMGVPDAG